MSGIIQKTWLSSCKYQKTMAVLSMARTKAMALNTPSIQSIRRERASVVASASAIVRAPVTGWVLSSA